MAENKISLEELYNTYTQGLGLEGAKKIIREAIVESGLKVEEEYTKEEALKICEALKKKGGFIKIIANLFSARLKLRHNK